ncbi:UPF0496 protein At2g18630-like [Neltuma alba]|uniref:UPF0496 protein At2g18630-like n=1 Tax=Neltuma alba TaxID=207710 RepID=UPI0010A42F0C|nr:UPF0496 protein At2g18630-like [Prosopis alba]XP_028763968.1 UPF0496 protein At2g18630-like [Prosopis alba]XP_028775587.1 UPF0496 protein At2g18630-like [Prosopis alba]
MMGGQSSKTSKADVPLAVRLGTNSQFAADLKSYETACVADPNLQSFDASIQERTNRVINSLANGVQVRSLSLDSLREVTDTLLENHEEVVRIFLACKNDIMKNEDLSSLVDEFFENSLLTLDFCNELHQCLRRARDNQVIIKSALNHFAVEGENGVEGARYVETLQQLKKFTDAGDPFTQEFYLLFESVYAKQVSMLEKLQARKRKLDKKLKSLKAWRRVANAIFLTAFVSVLIFSVVAAVVVAPPIVAALAGALTVPIGSVGKWCNSLFQGYEKAVKSQREVLSSMEFRTYITLQDLDSIRSLVNKLEIKIGSMLHNADFALKDEDAMELALDEIKKQMEHFSESIETLNEHADRCSREIRKARTVIIHKIIKPPR